MAETTTKKNVVDVKEVAVIPAEGEHSAALINAQQIADLNTLLKVSNELNKSGMFPQLRNNGQVLAVVLAGKERGYGPMTSLTNIHVINGRIGYSAQMIAAELRKAGVTYNVIETDTEHCKICFERKGQEPFTYEWTTEDATRARKLPAKPDSVWSTYPQDMLFSRCLSAGGKKFAPDAIMGAYLIDELPANGVPSESDDDPNDNRSRTEKVRDKLNKKAKTDDPQNDKEAAAEKRPAPPDEPSSEPAEAGLQGRESSEAEKKTESRKRFQAEIVALDGKCMNRKCVSVEKRKLAVLQAHHIIPRSLGGADVKENGLTLCPGCHRKAEEGGDVGAQRLSPYEWTLWVLEQWRGELEWRWEDSYAWLSKQS